MKSTKQKPKTLTPAQIRKRWVYWTFMVDYWGI